MPDDYQVNITASVDDLVSAMEQAGSSVEQLKGQLEGVGEGAESAEGGFAGLGEGLGELKEKMDEHLEGLTSMMGGWEGLMGVIGGGAVAEIMAKIAETTLEVGDSMRNTGAALNVSSSDARGFNEAMESLGVQSNAATMAIRRLEMDASNGGKSLARLGISTQDANGAMKSGMELFTETVDKLDNLTDANQKAEAGFTLLGRGAQQLLGVLPEINDRIADNITEQRNNTDTNNLAVQSTAALHQVLQQLQTSGSRGIRGEPEIS